MKHWSGQIFPITLLALLAGLTFWLQAVLAPRETQTPSGPGTEPDAIVENFEIRSLDDKGRLQYRLSAPQLQHYPADNSSRIVAPRLIAYRDTATPPLTLTAGRATATARGETVILEDSVDIVRAAANGRPELHATTSTLTVEPQAGTAHTDQAVTLTQGASQLSGIGARIDNKASTFELRSQVRGRYLSARAKP